MIKTPLSTMIGGAFWTPKATILGGASKTFDQLIKSLFANGEQGFAYDLNDLSTMFQDAAGTVPVTAAGQPVGLMLDKSRGLVLSNELVTNGDFSNGLTGWSSVVTATGTVNIVSNTAELSAVGAGAIARIRSVVTVVAGSWQKVQVDVSGNTSTLTVLQFGSAAGGAQYGSFSLVVGRNTFYVYVTGASLNIQLYKGADNGVAYIDNVSIKSIAGNHAYQTTSASRPILRQNATTGAYYLEFDGSDDSLQTSNIDFTATDKVSLFTGVQKLRSSTAESILELGVLPYDGVGTFWLTTNALSPDDVWMAIAQSWNARTGFSKITPVANNFIFSAKLDFAGSVAKDEVKPRLNGSTTGFTRGLLEHAGAGNFGNHSLYIGRRAGTSLPFNGHIYSLIGVGRLTTDDETIALEKDLAKRTGVTLS